MSFTDFDCGIKEPHIHTGELYENYVIEYFCPGRAGWVKNSVCEETGRPHRRCRTQMTSTEEIELILPDPEPVEEYLLFMLKKSYDAMVDAEMKRFLYGHNDGYPEGINDD